MARSGRDMSKRRVLRGGSYFNVTRGLRTTFRFRFAPGSRSRYYGFRVVVRRKP